MRFSLLALLRITAFTACLLGLLFYDNSEVLFSLPYKSQDAQLSRDGTLIAYLDPDGSACVFNLVQKKEILRFPHPPGYTSGLELTIDKKILLVIRWDPAKGKPIDTTAEKFYYDTQTGKELLESEVFRTDRFQAGQGWAAAGLTITLREQAGRLTVIRRAHWSGVHNFFMLLATGIIVWMWVERKMRRA